MFRGHVEAHFESGHRNGPPGHKCAGTFVAVTDDIRKVLESYGENALEQEDQIAEISQLLDFHGHSWVAEIDWTYYENRLDEYGWGPDFGKAKDIIRQYDHHNLNLMMKLPSAENLAKAIYEEFTTTFGFAPDFVKLHEGAGNTMTYTGEAAG